MSAQSVQRAFQSAWVVDDIEAAALRWVEATGAGPFFIADYPQGVLVDTFYREQATPITMKTALTQMGDMQIELIQPTGEQPNIYRDTVPAGGTGFHHICLWSTDVAADMAGWRQRGFEIAARGQVAGGVQFAYVDSSSALGHMTELLEYSDEIAGMFALISAAAAEWDGSDPIRSF
jgi:hypothetical protein